VCFFFVFFISLSASCFLVSFFNVTGGGGQKAFALFCCQTFSLDMEVISIYEHAAVHTPSPTDSYPYIHTHGITFIHQRQRQWPSPAPPSAALVPDPPAGSATASSSVLFFVVVVIVIVIVVDVCLGQVLDMGHAFGLLLKRI